MVVVAIVVVVVMRVVLVVSGWEKAVLGVVTAVTKRSSYLVY